MNYYYRMGLIHYMATIYIYPKYILMPYTYHK